LAFKISLDFKSLPYSDFLQDSDVNCDVGGDWYCGRSQVRDSENYKNLSQTQRQGN